MHGDFKTAKYVQVNKITTDFSCFILSLPKKRVPWETSDVSTYYSVVTHKHNIQTDKVWILRGMKVQCTVLQTFFHSISNKIKNQLLHRGQKHAREQVDGLKENAF